MCGVRLCVCVYVSVSVRALLPLPLERGGGRSLQFVTLLWCGEQKGVDASASGDVVIVAAGTFTGPGNTNIDLKGKAIQVLGSGGTPQRATSWLGAATPTVTTTIDCQGPAPAWNVFCRGFVFHSGEGPGTVVSGFEVYRPYAALYDSSRVDAYGVTGGAGMGAAVYVVGSSPTLSHLWLRSGWSSNYGGCMAVQHAPAAPVLDDVLFQSCYSMNYGGGMLAPAAGISVSNVQFWGTSAGVSGGGAYLVGGGSASSGTVVNASFTHCSATSDGGGLAVSSGGVTLGSANYPHSIVRGTQAVARKP